MACCALAVATCLVACGGGGSASHDAAVLLDGAADLTASTGAADLATRGPGGDGGGDLSGGGGDLGVVDGAPADLASGGTAAGTCTLTLSHLIGANAVGTSLTFSNLGSISQGENCNGATAPTQCNLHATGYLGSVMVNWASYQDFTSFADGTDDPLIAGGSTTTGHAIDYYLEGNNRWDAQSGDFVIDHRSGNIITLHIHASMAPNASAPGNAVGTFTLDTVCNAIAIAP